MDWFDLLAVQGTLKSLLQHHSLKASIFQCSAFFMVQLSCLYMTTGKTKALIRHTFVGKVMPLIFNTLSKFVIAFLSMSKCLISWLQSSSTVILEPKKIKSVTVSSFPPPVCHERYTFFPALVHTLFFFPPNPWTSMRLQVISWDWRRNSVCLCMEYRAQISVTGSINYCD